jgi:hypothetical protein
MKVGDIVIYESKAHGEKIIGVVVDRNSSGCRVWWSDDLTHSDGESETTGVSVLYEGR